MNKLTTTVEFDYIPVAEARMLRVNAGIDTGFAISKADCIDSAVKHLLELAIQYDDVLTGDVPWLLQWAMGAARAYREAAGAVA